MKVFYLFLLMLIGITIDLVGQESKFDTMSTTVITDVGSYKLPVLVTPFFENESLGEALREVKGLMCIYTVADGSKYQAHLVSSGGNYYVYLIEVNNYQCTGQWYAVTPQFGTEGLISFEYLHPMSGNPIGELRMSPTCISSEINWGIMHLKWTSNYYVVYTQLKEQVNRKAYALYWLKTK